VPKLLQNRRDGRQERHVGGFCRSSAHLSSAERTGQRGEYCSRITGSKVRNDLPELDLQVVGCGRLGLGTV